MTHGTSTPQAQPSPAPTALHQAATAYNNAATREAQGRYLTPSEQADFTRDQSAARAHGYTDHDVRAHAATLGPAVTA